MEEKRQERLKLMEVFLSEPFKEENLSEPGWLTFNFDLVPIDERKELAEALIEIYTMYVPESNDDADRVRRLV
jgi:hypothetical protein